MSFAPSSFRSDPMPKHPRPTTPQRRQNSGPRRAGRFALLAFMLATLSGLAQSAKPRSKGSPPSAGASCSSDAQQSLRAIACGLAESLGAPSVQTLVVSAPVAGAPNAKSGQELALRLAGVVAAALGENAQASTQTEALGAARGLAGRAGTLVHLKPKLSAAEFEVVADVFSVPKNFWDRVRDPRPSPTAHAFARGAIDAELRSFFPPVPLVIGRIDKATHSVQIPVALACGDIDSDRSLELLVVGRHEVSLGRLNGGVFVRQASTPWTTLSPVSPAPARQPMATARIAPGEAWVGLSDRARAFRLDAHLRSSKALARVVPWAPEGCASVDSIAMLPVEIDCISSEPRRRGKAMMMQAHALAGARIPQPAQPVRIVRAGIDANEERLIVFDGQGKSATLTGVGAQVAVGDLDGDGQPELVTSRPTLNPRKDGIDVHTWTDAGRLLKRYSLAVPEGVSALAICPPESLGPASLIVATPAAFWVVR